MIKINDPTEILCTVKWRKMEVEVEAEAMEMVRKAETEV